MAAQSPMQLSPPSRSNAGKRKFHSDSNDPTSPKKRRAADLQTETRTPNRPQNPPPTTGSYSQVYSPLLARLSHKFEVKAMSVMPSTSISRHVDRALEHLGRFSPWDQTILPGVVVLCAKSAATSKLITIAELVRRRIGESEQKWFQYNVPKEMVVEEPAPAAAAEPSVVVEDTFMAIDQGGDGGADDDDDDNEYFETRQPTIHEQAVQPAKVRYKAHMAVMLSRVPLDELQSEPNVSVQTNEERIEYLRKKRMGLAG